MTDDTTVDRGPLDLGDADTRGFAPLDPGNYNAEIVQLDWDATTNPNGNLPVGTPMLKIQVKILNPEIDGEVIDQDRRAFAQYFSPPRSYDARKRATMLGMMARFFMALGYQEEEVKSSNFNPNFEDLKNLPVVVTLGKEPKKTRDGVVIEGEFNNPIKSFRAAGTLEGTATTTGSGLL